MPPSAPPEWADAFRQVPRALFLPERVWPYDRSVGAGNAVDRTSDPEAWQRAAEGDEPVITQWDDGAHQGVAPGRVFSSSASAPDLVADMLALLDVSPEARVLEVGTGTGWNAALLAHRVGDANVVTVEVDPDIAAAAERALVRAGRKVRVVTGDGAFGVPDGAPYDRLIVTAGVRAIPAAWLGQVRSGGIILLPYGTPYSGDDALLRLTRREDGTASGRFRGQARFMKLRAQRSPTPTSPPGLPFRDFATDVWPPHTPWHPFAFIAGLHLRGAAHAVQEHEDGHTHWLYSRTVPGWTAAVRRGGDEVIVRQAGERALWDEMVATHAWWSELGEPGIDRFGLTVRPDGAHLVWLDEPENVIAPAATPGR
ncbi:methyltransferase domain-containing protein [Streptomyces hainanensis]|uniref:Protein-L-isoaspartate O-methyltransferase n=1 Tax=Streptomyces hainanensis TaxID=402648 RepID=A0A4R4TBK8_9ACTN|nr:methyltransferase domain-containing protein [Streptomyces hainanensis]